MTLFRDFIDNLLASTHHGTASLKELAPYNHPSLSTDRLKLEHFGASWSLLHFLKKQFPITQEVSKQNHKNPVASALNLKFHTVNFMMVLSYKKKLEPKNLQKISDFRDFRAKNKRDFFCNCTISL